MADQSIDASRAMFEAAVIARMKESGFLEIEIRTECLVRCDDGYEDAIINAGWHYWQAGRTSIEPASAPQPSGVEFAARFVEKRLHDYVSEHGVTDPDTGTVEYPGNGEEYVYELEEIIEGIRALDALPEPKGNFHG